MDYGKQQQFLARSRTFGAISVVALIAASISCFKWTPDPATHAIVSFAVIVAALAASLYYTPDYLHLTVEAAKGVRWQFRIRWRIIAAVLILGGIFSHSRQSYFQLFLALAWLIAANLLIKRLAPRSHAAALFWITDCALITTLLYLRAIPLLTGSVLLAAAIHLLLVTLEKSRTAWAVASLLVSGLVLVLGARQQAADLPAASFWVLLEVIAALATFWLVQHAQQQNSANIAAAMEELADFTGYPNDKIRNLWAISNQELARNWQAAAIAPDDGERLAQWYRDNSELYLFAISAYNLEYKRIRSNLKVLKFARGACLDYGAGNGELLLELARRGHPVTYYDVEGVTMRFARQRASRQKLCLEFARTRSDLVAAARKHGFDTIFAFDVLEHLPDLEGELDFLASLLNKHGLFVFDVPAGSTKAHPMHLNHDLNVLSYMRNKGLHDKRGLLLRLPFRKEEKYIFLRSGSPEASEKLSPSYK